jgi:mRNA-degrading endonuclease RelE of RelBE toxin-antitoxin system
MPQWFTWTNLFQKQLRGFDRLEANHILEAINGLRFGLGDVENMTDSHPPTKRLRIGAYRVIYQELPNNRFHILRFGGRGGVYKH